LRASDKDVRREEEKEELKGEYPSEKMYIVEMA
jgi:hypothetical protein